MKVVVRTVLNAPAARVWDEVRTTRLLEHVAAPLVRFDPVSPPAFPETWQEGRYLVRNRLFGVIGFGQQWIGISYPTDPSTPAGERFVIRDDGQGDLARTWDHHIVVQALPDGRALYTDTVEVRAGVLTPLVWLFASLFYRHRQRRWRDLVARGFRYA